MPDERTYGFNRDDADALIQSIGVGVGENWFPEIKPRGGGGTGVLSIRFQIISVFCETCQATAQVMSRPPGMSLVPQEDIYGQLRVYDLHGWLQEPDLDLEGRYGSATLRTWDTEACAIDPSLHTKWEIDSIYPIIVECPVE
jgi:hypothetical protein